MRETKFHRVLGTTLTMLAVGAARLLAAIPAEIRSIDPLAQAAPRSIEALVLPEDERPAAEKILPTLWELAMATEKGKTIRVIVSLNEAIADASNLAAEEQENLRVANIARVEHAFLQAAGELGLKNFKGLSHFAVVMADIDPQYLPRLAALPLVKNIERVWQVVPARVEGGALIHSTNLRNSFGGTGAGIGVAVFDSGVDASHPELATRVTVQGDFTGSGGGTFDAKSHGTSVAGIIAGTTSGVAPQAEIWAIKVLDNNGSGSVEQLFNALNSAYANRNMFGGLNIINMSLGFPDLYANFDCDSNVPAFAAIVNQLVGAGISIFVSSGNEGRLNGIAFPSCLANVISVGAVSDAAGVTDVGCTSPTVTYPQADQILCYSNSGFPLDILAPSACARTPRSFLVGGGYETCFDGTSAASPYAAGVAAQILSLRPNISPAQLKTVLAGTGKPITDVNGITRNRIDAVQAYQSLIGGSSGPCIDSSTTLCLLNKRFKIEATYRTASGQTGTAKAVRLTEETGYFWFFNQTNIEVVFKLLNGCGLNSRYWVFAGGLTDVEVSTTVTDTAASGPGAVRTFFNPLAAAFQPIADSSAFATCP